MTPRALYRLPLPEGTRLTLCVLYDSDDIPPGAVHAWEEGRVAEPPFVWSVAGYQPLQDITGRSRSRIAEDLRQLADLGVIRRATREGRRGWDLLGTRREPAAGPTGGTRGSQSADPRVPSAGPAGPSRGTPTPSAVVPRTGPTGPSAGTSGSHRQDPTRTPAPPRAVSIQQEKHRDESAKLQAGRGEAANEPPSLAAVAASSRRIADRPAPPAVQAPGRALLLRLAREFGDAFVPRVPGTDQALESRRIRPDADTLRRLAELLTAPDDVDPGAWLDRQVELVSGYVRDYATICEADPEQAHHWGGNMLEVRPLKGQRSAWETLTRIVDRWREAQAAAREAERSSDALARAAGTRAVAERLAELELEARAGETPGARAIREQLGLPERDRARDHAAAVAAVEAARAAGRPVTLAEVEAAVAASGALVVAPLPAPGMARAPAPERPPLTPEDEGRIRSAGRRREQQARRAEVDAIETNRRINEALRLFCERAGRPPNAAEAEEIRRRFGGGEATGT